MTKPGYKMTEIGEIPEEWNISELGNNDISEIVKSGGTPLKSNADFWHGEIPFVTIGEMTNAYKYIYNTSDSISVSAVRNSLTFLVPPDSLLISMYGTVGKLSITKRELAISQNIAAIIPNKSKMNTEFLFYAISAFSQQFRATKVITLKHLDIQMVKNFKIPLPPLHEQQKIAEILTTVDKKIEFIDQEILAAERVKKGLMQTLLTKGIGHTKFKMTEIGEIPEEWNLEPFREILQVRKRSNRGKSEKAFIIPMELIPENGIYCKYKYIEEDEVIPPTYCEPGDILLPKITPSIENGKQGIVPNLQGGHAFATSEVFPIVAGEKLLNLFTFYLLKTDLFRQPLINSMVGATGRQRVTKDSLYSLLLPVPLLPEQQKIAEILTTADRKIELLKEKRQKAESLKKGLMQVLLTGQVRVKVDKKEMNTNV
ncbi:MAG: restriction endonuclease subunit S [Thermoplasmatales archaeon]